MKSLKFTALILLLFSQMNKAECQKKDASHSIENHKIQVLNFGTFHMSYTPDAETTEFDENDIENQKSIHEVAKMLSAFKPTVIIVEYQPGFNENLLVEYNEYLENPLMKYESPSEVELLAYEIGRLSNTKRIYGIDHQMNYNYRIGSEILNTIDSASYNSFYSDPSITFPFLAIDESKLTLLEKLQGINSDSYLDFLITVNADMLTHAGTDGQFEGADEAAKYYQRNLRMYSNLNRIPLSPDDRVFILMGASHTAFFRDFMNRSPKYHMVKTSQYLVTP